MSSFGTRRDYSLTGASTPHAHAAGLVSANWYQTDIPRKTMKALMTRRDAPAIRDTLLWLALLVLFAGLGYLSWGTLWAIPCFVAYGVLYGSASDSRWHECSHGTAFKTRWMNDAVYQIASFMVFRESHVWKWSHARHHTDTIVVGRDYEIMAKRPVQIARLIAGLFGIPQTWGTLKSLLQHAGGDLNSEERNFIPLTEQTKVIRYARQTLLVHAAIIALALHLQSFYLVMVIGVLPSMYGVWIAFIFGLTQHAGLPENVLDHRLNCRTILMNPVFRFIYSNMNYHTEHHMFPMVPYHALPQLHELMKAELPVVYPSTFSAIREMLPALLIQTDNPEYDIQRELPQRSATDHQPAQHPQTA
ncbi:fatty acid desaturase family protein [Parathalassolituus penaei]|uniref:Fatty acid desaturase family protein n=1 Tax=Parathalassolituus penaei TaxID=2997323 RepID=A0A9X3IR87_9GAMM|nr:fatty acid desaturase family protein [Parathalassolituus penaei]MCY0964611.1 fatty acid desaturase family protein [Parathalassolituus penaei]